MTKPARSGTDKEQARPSKTREAAIRYDLSRDDWDLGRDQGNKHFAGQMRLHLGPSLDGLRSDETGEMLVRRGIRFIAFRCRTHAPKWPTLADQLVNTLAKTLADFASNEEAVAYEHSEPGDEVTVECILSPDAAMEAELLGRTGAGLEAVERPAADEKREEPHDEIIAKALEKVQDEGLLRHEPQEDEQQRQEDRLPPPAEQLQAVLVRLLKKLIPSLPPDPAGKAEAALALNRDLNRAFWEELRGELVPAIKPLLQGVPGDYEGKRARAALVNSLLSTFGLAILIQDDHGRAHLCSMHPVRARESDVKGNLRLRERTVSGSSQKSYPIPSSGELQIVEIPYQEPDPHPRPARTGRGG